MLSTDASEVEFPNEYTTKERVRVPAPWFVAGKVRPKATSTSLRFIPEGSLSLCRNRELPSPVTVPEEEATKPPAKARE